MLKVALIFLPLHYYNLRKVSTTLIKKILVMLWGDDEKHWGNVEWTKALAVYGRENGIWEEGLGIHWWCVKALPPISDG
jgi:hypothetical protein